MRGLRVLGVVEVTKEGPRIAYVNEDVEVSEDLLGLAAPAGPSEIFRFAARCEERCCVHFDGNRCKLAMRIVRMLPAVVDALPPCLIRTTCRWFEEEGGQACLRCPQVVTESSNTSPEYVRAATPQD